MESGFPVPLPFSRTDIQMRVLPEVSTQELYSPVVEVTHPQSGIPFDTTPLSTGPVSFKSCWLGDFGKHDVRRHFFHQMEFPMRTSQNVSDQLYRSLFPEKTVSRARAEVMEAFDILCHGSVVQSVLQEAQGELEDLIASDEYYDIRQHVEDLVRNCSVEALAQAQQLTRCGFTLCLRLAGKHLALARWLQTFHDRRACFMISFFLVSLSVCAYQSPLLLWLVQQCYWYCYVQCYQCYQHPPLQ